MSRAYKVWTEDFTSTVRLNYTAISDETSPTTVVLLMRRHLKECVVLCANPGDETWVAVDAEECRHLLPDTDAEEWPVFVVPVIDSIWYSSVAAVRGRVYLAMREGNILVVSVNLKPKLVPVVTRNRLLNDSWHPVDAYILPANQYPPSSYFAQATSPARLSPGKLLMIHYHRSVAHLNHLSTVELDGMKNTKQLIEIQGKVEDWRNSKWQQFEVYEVDLASWRLEPVLRLCQALRGRGVLGLLRRCERWNQ